MQTHTHICQTCGDTKIVVLEPHEKPEDLQGCVCDRTVERHRFKDNDLMAKIPKDYIEN